nr:hypothetical protein [Gammaproteobacteria bacterium]
MNKKVRRILFTFLFFLSVFLLVGCGKITTTTTKDNTVVTTTTQNQGDNSGETTSHEYDYSKRGDTTLYVHYLRYKGDYTGWDLWAWDYAPINGAGAGYKFVTSTDEFGGVVASLPVKRGITEVGFIIRQGGDDWTGKDIERDRIVFIPEDSTMDNPVHIYVLENTVEFTVNEVAKVKAKLLNASFKNEQTIIANSTTEMDESTIKLYKGDSELSIASKTLSSDKMTVTIVMSEKVDYTKDYNVYAKFEEDSTVQATFEGLYDYPGFGEAFNYDGELGVSVSESSTIFRLWAPVSTDVKLNIYSTGTAITDSDEKHPGTDTPDEVIQMVKGEKGVWSYTADSNMHGKYYTYSVTTSGSESEVMDPYAYSCGVNGRRGLVVDFSQINPTGWEYDNRPDSVVNENDAIIYEMHVRDLTCSSTWGGGRYKKGTFLALTETGTKYKSGNMTVTTGFDHIKELGVNTVQILPFFDWSDNVDETDLNNSAGKYSWGYMPVNYNCLEGSYSTNPYDGFNRIKEFKQMVMAYTEAGIRINM